MNKLSILLFFCFSIAKAQNTLDGTVFLYKEKGTNAPLENVYVKGPGAGSYVTKQNGSYSFAFDNTIDVVKLNVRKDGYEVINDEELENLDLKKKKQQNVYLDIEGNTEKRKRELLDAAVGQSKKRREEYYRILDKGGKEANQLKLKLEKEAGKKFADLNEVRSYIFDKFGADSKSIEAVVTSIIKQNLDHTNKEVEKIREYTLKSQLDSALFLLNRQKDQKLIMKADEQIRSSNEIKKLTKAKYLESIPILLSNGLYNEVDLNYQMIIFCDTTDIKSYFKYAYFLQQQNQFTKAINLYNQFIKKIKKDDEYLLGTALNNLGILLEVNNKRTTAAKQYYYEALEIRKRLAAKNPEVYEPDVAMTLNNLGLLLTQINNKTEAKNIYEEALEIYRRLAAKYPDAYERYIAAILNNLGSLLDDFNNTTDAKKNYEEALKIRRRLTAKKPNIYEQDIASTLNNLGVSQSKSNDKTGAKKSYEEALEIRRRLALKNPDVYESELAMTLNNLGVLLNDVNGKTGSKKNHEEALEIRKRLAVKNPDAYESDVTMSLNNLGNLLNDLNDTIAAKKRYEEALEIFRRLVAKNPDVYEPDMAMSLNNFGSLLNKINDKQGAKNNYENSLGIYKRLADKNPDVYDPYVATVLNNFGNLMRAINDTIGAKKSYEEALEIYIRLAAKNPEVFERDMAMTLNNLKILLNDINSQGSLKKDYKDALAIYIQIQELKPGGFTNYNIIKKTLGALAELFNKSCEKDSAYKYYILTLVYSDSVITTLQDMLKHNSDANLNDAYSFYEGNASWYALHAKRYSNAQQYAVNAIKADTSQHWVETNLAHALLFQGQFNEAETIYKNLKSRPYEQDSTKTYGQALLEDFQSLDCSGAIPPERKVDVEKIREMLNKIE